MNADPDYPAAEQAYTPFTLPARPLELALLLPLTVVVLNTAWDVITATGSFTEAPEPIRAAVLAGVSYFAIRCARTGLRFWRRYGRRDELGPDIERIDTP